MIRELLYKWFGLVACQTCEVLREQLAYSEQERRELLHRLLTKDQTEPPVAPISEEAMTPIGKQFIPWRVRQQMLEQEDRKRAQLTKEKEKEISELEKELGVS